MEWRTLLHGSWSQPIYESCDRDSRWCHLEAGQQMPATLQDKVNYTTEKEKAVTLYKDFSIMWQVVGLLYDIQPADKTDYPK